MVNALKLLEKARRSPSGLRFDEACALAETVGFTLARIEGSHHIFRHEHLRERINFQRAGGQVKAYQVRQLLKVIDKHGLTLEDEP